MHLYKSEQQSKHIMLITLFNNTQKQFDSIDHLTSTQFKIEWLKPFNIKCTNGYNQGIYFGNLN